MIRINVRRGNAAVAGALLLSTAACGGSGGAHPTQSATTRPAAGDITAKSGTEILAAAKDALVHSRSVRIKGTMNVDGGSLSMNMRVGQGCGVGSMTMPFEGKRLPVDVRLTDERLYLRSRRFLRAVAGGRAAQAVGDRWFAATKSQGFDQFRSFADLRKFAEIFTADGGVTKGQTAVVRGTPAIALKDPDGSVLYIATKGKPYPLQLTPGTPTSGEHLDLLDYDLPLTVTAPAHALDPDHPTPA